MSASNLPPAVTVFHIGNEFQTPDTEPHFGRCRNAECDFEGVVEAAVYLDEDTLEKVWTCPDCVLVPERKHAAEQANYVPRDEVDS